MLYCVISEGVGHQLAFDMFSLGINCDFSD